MAKKLTRTVIKMRKAIAQDVIAQIKAKRYDAQTGIYVGLDIKPWEKLETVTNYGQNKSVDLQEIVGTKSKKAPKCTVCALGGTFISAVRLTNAVSAAAAFTDDDAKLINNVNVPVMQKKLQQYFSKLELGVIEAFFEDQSGFIRVRESEIQPIYVTNQRVEFNHDAFRLRELLNRFGIEDRMILIMQAIADLANTRITVRAFRDWFHSQLTTNARLLPFRQEFGM